MFVFNLVNSDLTFRFWNDETFHHCWWNWAAVMQWFISPHSENNTTHSHYLQHGDLSQWISCLLLMVTVLDNILLWSFLQLKINRKVYYNSLFCCWLFVNCFSLCMKQICEFEWDEYLNCGVLLTRSQGYCNLWHGYCAVIKIHWPPWWLTG